MAEANAVATVVESLALSRPEVAFFLRSAYPLVVGTIRSALAQERQMGGGAPPEERSEGLTLIGQFAGRCECT